MITQSIVVRLPSTGVPTELEYTHPGDFSSVTIISDAIPGDVLAIVRAAGLDAAIRSMEAEGWEVLRARRVRKGVAGVLQRLVTRLEAGIRGWTRA